MSRLRLISLMLALPVASAMGGELGGSRASMREQHDVAKEHDFTFLRSAAQVREFVAKERLVEVVPSADLLLSKVSFPYTRPFLRTFIERLAAQYHRATGGQLVVTSMTRPMSQQPRNASPLSVHPAGMAVDFRVPQSAAQRRWLEETLLSLEDKALLDVTLERNPPHYHVAVFPDRYEAYLEKLIPREQAAAAAAAAAAAVAAAAAARQVLDDAARVAASVPAPARFESGTLVIAAGLGAALAVIMALGVVVLRARVKVPLSSAP